MDQINVSIVCSERLYPIELSSPRAVPLSLLDATTANFALTNAIWLFERPVNPQLSDRDFDEHFRQSLRITLNYYPQWCGILKSITGIDGSVDAEASGFPPHARRFGRIYAHYGTANDPGVDFAIAKSPVTLDFLSPVARPTEQPIWNRHEKALNAFVSPATVASPLTPNELDEAGQRKPLLGIQITHLACGGLVLAAKSTHPLADITTLVCLMKDWAKVSRALFENKDAPELTRVFGPFRLDDQAASNINADHSDQDIVQLARTLPLHRYDWWQMSRGSPWPVSIPEVFQKVDISPMGTTMPWEEWDVKEPISYYTVHLTRNQVDRLWEQANIGSGTRISRHDAVLAHIWSCISRARRLEENEEPVHCDLVYGVRPALKLEETFLGSPIIMVNIELPSRMVLATTQSASGEGVSVMGPIAQEIRKTLGQMSNAENIKAHLHDLAFEKSPQRIWQAFLGRRHIIVTTWARAGLYDIDFGLGSRIRFADGLIPDMDGVVLIKEAPGDSVGLITSGSWTDNGVDVSVQIRADDMQRLLSDPLLLPVLN